MLFWYFFAFCGEITNCLDVNTGEIRVAKAGIVLRSVAIGSCVVVAAYDSYKKIGAMAHIMLPGRSPRKVTDKTRYAVDAVRDMIEQMLSFGSSKSDIEVCLVGGGNVLRKKDDTICRDNIDSTMYVLLEGEIPIRAAVLGGTTRKGVSLNIEHGCVYYTEADEHEKLLWRCVSRVA